MRPRSSPESGGERRASPLYAWTTAILTSIGAVHAAIAHLIAPVPQPATMAFPGYSYGNGVVRPDADMERILNQSHEELAKFFEKNGEIDDTSILGFWWSYRLSPEVLQKNNWKGPCNTFSEFFNEWAAYQGHSSYIVNLCPNNPIFVPFSSWHQISVTCIEKDRLYLIGDNKTLPLVWHGTLDQYVANTHPDMTILPLNGVRKWMRTQPNIVARMSIQIGFNQEPEASSTPLQAPVENIVSVR